MQPMMKKILTACLLMVSSTTWAQTHYTKNGFISFFSRTSLENIAAENNQVTSAIDLQTGDLQFSLPIRGFRFRKALMEEHFNENYLESDKFPKALFKGKITGWKGINLGTDGSYPVKVSGQLTMHGVTNPVSTDGTLEVRDGKITGRSVFTVKLADYRIQVPRVVRDNISETIEITVACKFDQSR